jgi:hypothetical protein
MTRKNGPTKASKTTGVVVRYWLFGLEQPAVAAAGRMRFGPWAIGLLMDKVKAGRFPDARGEEFNFQLTGVRGLSFYLPHL